MKQKFLLLFSMVASILFVGCTDAEPEKVDPTLGISDKTLNFEADGASKTVDITSNTSWNIEVEGVDWLIVSPVNGDGDAQITITANENTATQERSTKLTVTAENLSEVITITQSGIDAPSEPDDTFEVGMLEMIYNGDKFNSNTIEWDIYLYNDVFVASSGIRGEYIKLQLVGDPDTQTFRDGPLTGTFAENYEGFDISFEAGDIAASGYGKGSDDELFYYFVTGDFVIENPEGDTFTFVGEFEAENGTLFKINHSVDIKDNTKVSLQDQTYNSDIEEDYVQNITAIFAEYNGDALQKGNAVWKMHIWGDGATVDENNHPTNGEGTYVCIQFYAPLGQMTPEGIYTVGSVQACAINTIEPGHSTAAGYVGTWLYEMGDYYVTGMTPAISGELEIVDNGNGTHSVKYNFGDDNPYGDTKYFSGEFNDKVTFINRIDTGFFNDQESSFCYYADKICDNHSWVLNLVSNEFIESNGENGITCEFTLTTAPSDSYYVNIAGMTWNYNGELCEDNYSIYRGSIKTYKDGVVSESAVNGGTIACDFAENNNFTFCTKFQDITTEDGKTYNWLYYSEMERTNMSIPPFEDINMSEEDIATSKLEYYGYSNALYTNWDIAMYNAEYDGAGEDVYQKQMAIILSIHLDGAHEFEEGLPSGTYQYRPNSDAEGIWSSITLVKRGFDYPNIVSGSIDVENLGDNNYRYTFDLQLDKDDAKIIGTYQGTVSMVSHK